MDPEMALVCPPSTTTVVPIMNRPASEASSKRAPSRSPACPKRPTGIAFLMVAPLGPARKSRLRSVTIHHGAVRVRDTGVVDEDIDSPEHRLCSRKGSRHRVAVPHVGGYRERSTAGLGDMLDKRVQALLPACHQHHRRAACRQYFGKVRAQ